MRNKKDKKREQLTYYAKILIVISFVFLIYGAILDVNNDRRLYDPIKDVTKEEKSTINISTTDDSEVIPGNTTTSTENSTDTIKNSTTNEAETTNNPANNNSNNNSNTTAPSTPTYNNSTPSTPTYNNSTPSTPINNNPNPQNNNIPTIEEVNNNLRNKIQSTYGITIKYGDETNGYTVAGISTTPVTNSTTINANLTKLNQTLSLYPSGFFAEIKNGGIPLTIMLINNYSEDSVTGVTDSSYTYAVISIAVKYSFEESFYHESYHYIERYMFKKGANFNTWYSFNPNGFAYGNINNNLSYSNTFSQDAYFVNNYAQTSPEEDRASTFEYMMASSKASCLNYGTTIWKKADAMRNMIDVVYNSVNPATVEYWERFL